MIKILILVAIAALTTFLGVLLSAGKKKRKEVFGELYEFNERLLINMKYGREPVSKIAEDFTYVPKLLNGESVLDGNDGEAISEYFVSLGKSDALSQIDYLNGRKTSLAKLRDESAENYKKYSSLYIKIFFMVGVLIAVLLA